MLIFNSNVSMIHLLLRQFTECSGADCHPESEGFLGRIKRFWGGHEGEEKRPS
jgi:molecular chaperone DnaJ